MSSPASTSETIIVTGGLGGIGIATCKRLAADGFKIVALDVIDPTDEQRQAFADIDDAGAPVTFEKCDITSEKSVVDMLDKVASETPNIRSLVTAHGIETRSYLHELEESDFRRVYDVNVVGTVLISKATLRHWMKNKAEHDWARSIVHVSSTNGVIATPMHTAYGSSKGAVEQMTRAMAVELAKHGIRVNAVGPGATRTQLMDSLMADKPHALDSIFERTPMRRLADPEEIASVISFLVGDDASYVTGQTIFADGGRTAQNLPS